MKGKKTLALVLALILAISLLAGCGSSAPAASSASASTGDSAATASSSSSSTAPSDGKVYEVKINSFDSENTVGGGSLKKAEEWINEQGGGRINCKVYFNATLLDPGDCLAGTAQGIADITDYQVEMIPGVTPVAALWNLPFTSSVPGCREMTKAAKQLMLPADSIYQQELAKNGLSYVTVTVTRGMDINTTTDIAAYTPADVKGQKFIGVSELAPMLEKNGASVVSLDVPDWYLSLEKGVVTGSIHSPALVKDLMEYEVVDATTSFGDMGLHTTVCAMIANSEWWNSLPSDIQEIIAEGLSGSYARLQDSDEVLEVELFDEVYPAEGNSHYVATDEDMQLWYDAAAMCIDAWKEKVNGLGFDAEAIYNEYLEAIAANS